MDKGGMTEQILLTVGDKITLQFKTRITANEHRGIIIEDDKACEAVKNYLLPLTRSEQLEKRWLVTFEEI
jgi:hypothetical protein